MSTSSYPSIRQSVVIADVNMTIGAMCRFMIKWAIAAIPAAIILWVLMMAVAYVTVVFFGGAIHGLLGDLIRRY